MFRILPIATILALFVCIEAELGPFMKETNSCPFVDALEDHINGLLIAPYDPTTEENRFTVPARLQVQGYAVRKTNPSQVVVLTLDKTDNRVKYWCISGLSMYKTKETENDDIYRCIFGDYILSTDSFDTAQDAIARAYLQEGGNYLNKFWNRQIFLHDHFQYVEDDAPVAFPN